ncbi:MAG TPA: hypothetical protein VKT49_26560 [Bryobacteraceae bacterium]|nr:hypothetical protein [Bryobacteraceae bacterium]
MRPWTVAGCLFTAMAAHGQHVVFTMLTPATCPVVISSVSSSRDFGFQSLMLLNDSAKSIDSIRFKVVLAASRDQVADGGHVFARLEPGDKKMVDVFLGRRPALVQLARELKLQVARAIVTVEAVDFADGTQWTGDPPIEDLPIRPLPVNPEPR